MYLVKHLSGLGGLLFAGPYFFAASYSELA